MDYIAELDKVLKMLQELEVVAKYGNIKKLTAAMEAFDGNKATRTRSLTP